MFCKKCGAEILEGSRFCSKCGTPIGTNVEQNSAQTPIDINKVTNGANSNSGFIYRVIAIIVFLLLLAWGGFTVFKGVNEPKPVQDKQQVALVVKSETIVDDYIRDSAAAQTKYDGKTVQITGKVLHKNQFSNSVDFCVTLYTKMAGGKNYTVSIAVPVQKVNEVNKLKDGDFVNAEGKFVGVVPQKDPLDVSIQINAYNINETKI